MEMRARTRIKEWGNSLGVVIPREIVAGEELAAHDEIVITISKSKGLGDFFGVGRGLVKDSQNEKDEARKLWKMD